MVRLDENLINNYAAYHVTVAKDKSKCKFTSDFGADYTVSFDKDDSLLITEAYHLVLTNTNNVKSPNDAKVRDTVIAIVEAFFAENTRVMLFICETGDRKQAQRNRIFSRWFNTYARRADFTMLQSDITDEDGVVNYAAVLFRNDNPFAPQITFDFLQTCEILQRKP